MKETIEAVLLNPELRSSENVELLSNVRKEALSPWIPC